MIRSKCVLFQIPGEGSVEHTRRNDAICVSRRSRARSVSLSAGSSSTSSGPPSRSRAWARRSTTPPSSAWIRIFFQPEPAPATASFTACEVSTSTSYLCLKGALSKHGAAGMVEHGERQRQSLNQIGYGRLAGIAALRKRLPVFSSVHFPRPVRRADPRRCNEATSHDSISRALRRSSDFSVPGRIALALSYRVAEFRSTPCDNDR